MKIYRSIQYIQNGIGYFPDLYKYVNHGFSWGRISGNMSFSHDDVASVRQNIRSFFEKLEMGDIRNSIHMIPEHKARIITIDKNTIKTLPNHRFGRACYCDVLLTQLSHETLTVKVGDCTTAIIYAKSKHTKGIIGLVHTGRRGAEMKLPLKLVSYLIKSLDFNKEDIIVGIVPHLFKKNRKFENLKKIRDRNIWNGFIEKRKRFFYIDETGLVIDQYIRAGIHPNNLFVYHVNTFRAAASGDTFSHKYHLEMEKKGKSAPEGRFLVAVHKYDNT